MFWWADCRHTAYSLDPVPYSLIPLFPYSLKPMSKRIAGPEIERLIQLLARVPGLGPRSARRAALHLIKKKEALLVPLGGAMQEAAEKVRICSCCGNVDTSDPCTICTDERRDPATLIVVEDVSDLWALERAGTMNVRYHVLGGRLSPLDGIGPDDLNIKGLVERVAAGEIREVILAVNATVEGQTTAHYITDQLSSFDVRVTRLAHGVPVGGELDYLDEGTLAAALRARTTL
ncbi:recombination protein RecR [Brucella intermedia LMG 3301]|uniref:Recombination protein RecR n=4 Tax=Brucella intermedia TaxID=94625 RepID=C4WER7_9HYPH|nr:recombination protein RecR [Brucella intermedia LMG 3301]SUB11610.1 Recombination protein RecR [Brucella intermedia]